MPSSDSPTAATLPRAAGATATKPREGEISANPDQKPNSHSRGTFRPDIEGLRAVAVGLVVLYHAGMPFLPGGFVGVDVFFVISGFLISTQLLSELRRKGRISLAVFYARRAKRILPAAALVLASTAVLVWLFIPKSLWEEISGDIIASAIYLLNWRLADRSIDYLSVDSQPSPVQHFWSLAVEEQFYLVWPLLILLAALAAKRLGWRTGPVLWLGLAFVAVPSFVWAIVFTSRTPEQAFFVTTTRMWELAIGAAVALAAGSLARLGRRASVVIAWAGIAAILAAGILFNHHTPWPGYWAALPTVGTAAVIAGGFATDRYGPATVLNRRPFQWVGGLSYSLYVWHWPLIVIATAYWGELSMRRGLAVAAASVVPAWLTHRFVENPLRFSGVISRSSRVALGMGAACTVLGVIVGLGLSAAVSPTPDPVGTPQNAPGAAVLAANPRNDPAGAPVPRVDYITPDPNEATKDVPKAQGCMQDLTRADVRTCSYGRADAPTTIALVGDSKAFQWLPALEILAGDNDWRINVYTKGSCAFSTAVTPRRGGPYESCTQWNSTLLQRLVRERPDYAITSQGSRQAIGPDGQLSMDAMVAGMRESWRALTEVGSEIIVVADNPSPGFNVFACVEQHRDDLTRCTYPRSRRGTTDAYTTQVRAVEGQPNVHLIDVFDAICPTDLCAPVIGNVLVYRSGAHITATYVRTLTPRLAAALTSADLPAKIGPE